MVSSRAVFKQITSEEIVIPAQKAFLFVPPEEKAIYSLIAINEKTSGITCKKESRVPLDLTEPLLHHVTFVKDPLAGQRWLNKLGGAMINLAAETPMKRY